jgi:hypothetical protein
MQTGAAMIETNRSGLAAAFAESQVQRLATDNMLRGAWAEFLVNSYLGADLAEPWCYFDMTWRSIKVSVKQSVGPTARFDVAPKQFAWDASLKDQGYEGWRGHKGRPKQHWCDLYVFAWLQVEHLAGLSCDRVLDPKNWKFAVASWAEMGKHFAHRKTASGKTIDDLFGYVTAPEIAHQAEKSLAKARDYEVPPRDDRPQEDGPSA